VEPKKRWDGYRSFSYLEEGVDYRPYRLEPQLGRVEPFRYPLSVDDDERAGLENPSEFPNVIRWLVAHGYTDQQIAAVVGANVLRALGRVWV
jgi:microsomal dipeptidase-like Zn-dependent dipeptidase